MDAYRLDLTCLALADMFKSKSAEEVLEIFSVKDELTPEEEEDLREELKCALE
ncbi:SKP1-like protein 11 [Morus notabilis]|uniref:SKP1-like protein 11 n=1 Tax=Morus notabilis TaxID=981085 RepID=W9SUL5_9ROSA|nr:SKP1-like protein 11 [Morus notabilis]EXC27863.1 SKP1-like protein 11 [Morus notabilis]EXC27866.1 SKP1-like protein 11 [Morus notabilis]